MATGAALACVLFLVQSLSAALGKYVYVPDEMMWHQAQNYCREHHTDLAPVSGDYDWDKMKKLLPEEPRTWIGLERNSSDGKTWRWSGGGKALKCFWTGNEPNNKKNNEDNAMVDGTGWFDAPGLTSLPSVCFNVTVVMERKIWQEALRHCEAHRRSLASVASDTEMLLIQKELEKSGTSESVWTGLRNDGEKWSWKDGQPLDYEAWGPDGQLSCPSARRCGGLRKRNVRVGHVFAPDEPKWEWEAYKCAREKYFICA